MDMEISAIRVPMQSVMNLGESMWLGELTCTKRGIRLHKKGLFSAGLFGWRQLCGSGATENRTYLGWVKWKPILYTESSSVR